MLIIGCDFHTRYQQIAMMDDSTGELTERRLDHQNGEANTFYRSLPKPVRAVDGGSTASSVYDALGHRVRKTTSAYSLDYIYDSLGREVVEISSSCGCWSRGEVYAGGRHLATYANGTTYFINADWLGTERVRTAVNGSIFETCQSLPYGDGLSCSGGDVSPLHFTGKMHDGESNLDDFGARYYTSTMGRWMTPDWSARGEAVPYATLTNPQSLNLYAYVLDNPETSIDADGHKTGPGDSAESTNGCGENKTTCPDQNQRPGTNGPFTAQDPEKYMGKVVGSGQCVDFVKADTAVPRQTKDWAPGDKVGTKTPKGVAVATFGRNGRYQNTSGQSHAAELVSVAPNGRSAVIRDQWKGQPVHTRTIYNREGKGLPVNDLSRYNVIMKRED